jgi:2-dehydro-3-deoxyphosphogluconate aldolase/(4S)-4-hydroxy-2-oxoglutarate aldolase
MTAATAGTAASARTADAAGATSAAGTRTPPLRELLAKFGVVPVVAVSSADEGLRLGEALLRGGLPVVEITFRTDAAAAAIRAVTAALPELVVGAGTLLSEASVDSAVDAGAAFGVAPGPGEDVRHDEGRRPVPGVGDDFHPSSESDAVQ